MRTSGTADIPFKDITSLAFSVPRFQMRTISACRSGVTISSISNSFPATAPRPCSIATAVLLLLLLFFSTTFSSSSLTSLPIQIGHNGVTSRRMHLATGTRRIGVGLSVSFSPDQTLRLAQRVTAEDRHVLGRGHVHVEIATRAVASRQCKQLDTSFRKRNAFFIEQAG